DALRLSRRVRARLPRAVPQPSFPTCPQAERDRARRRRARAGRGAEVEAGQRLQRLLAWMELQDFSALSAGDPSLLRQVELIVIDGHRRLYEAQGKAWSEPVAYHWLRYDDSMPAARLAEGL